jgi:DNA polymerase III subunit delta'
MTKELLIDPKTKRDIDVFLSSRFPCIAFIGPKGSGKTYLAQHLADRELDDSINISSSAIKEIDAKSSGIEDVRDLQKTLSLSTVGTGKIRRVVIISNFDYFGHEAQNSLLKTLEEPPIDTLIIITANDESKVLDTIYSRVKKINVRPISLELAMELNFEQAEISKAYSLSMGQPGLLINLLEQKDSHPLVEAINDAKILLSRSKAEQVSEIDKIIKSKQADYVEIFVDAMLRILYASYNLLIDKNAGKTEVQKAHGRLVAVNECIADIRLGLNKKLSLTRLMLKI